MNTNQSDDLVRRLIAVIVEVIAETGEDGVPAGILYAALMVHGLTLEKFERLMQAILALKLIRKESVGHRYFITDEGRKLVSAAQSSGPGERSSG